MAVVTQEHATEVRKTLASPREAMERLNAEASKLDIWLHTPADAPSAASSSLSATITGILGMETILREIEHALTVKLYYLAVALSLTIPDICSALQSQDGRASGAKFAAWFDANLAAKYPYMTGGDCYGLRCGVVHQGRLGRGGAQYGRVIFLLIAPGIHNNIMNDALQLSAETFCKDMVYAARRWFGAKQNDVNVQANLPRLVQLRPNGLAPYIVGAPIIA